MREITFRGRYLQGIENAGCWVYWGLSGTDVLDAIDRDTIGQFTGLKDSQGKEIYEGDVVALTKEYIVDHRKGTCFDGKPEVVRWDDKDTGFVPFIWSLSDCPPWYDQKDVEVIGNIYMNPELLSESKGG